MTVTHKSRNLKYLQNYSSEQRGKALASVGLVLPALWHGSPWSSLVVRRIWAVFLEQEAPQLWCDEEQGVWYWGRICHSEYKLKPSSLSRCRWLSLKHPCNRPPVLMLHGAKPRCWAILRDTTTSECCSCCHLLPWTQQRLKCPLLCAVACSGVRIEHLRGSAKGIFET